MAILAHPRKWSFKPPVGTQINWGHPLANKLAVCFLLNEGGGLYLQDIASGGVATNINPLQPDWVSDNIGMGIESGSNFNCFSMNSTEIGTPFTAIGIFKDTGSGGYHNGGRIVGNHDDVNYPSGKGWNLYAGAGEPSAHIGFYFPWVGAESFPFLNLNWGTYNKHYFVAGGMQTNGGVATGWLGFLGQSLSKDTMTPSGAYRTGTAKILTNMTNYTMHISLVLIYKRFLSDAEINQLNADPYCFLVPPARSMRMLYGVSGAAPVTRNFLGLDRRVPRHVMRGVMRGFA